MNAPETIREDVQSAPTELPDEENVESLEDAPRELAPQVDLDAMLGRYTRPTMTPPSERAEEITGAGVSAWHNAKKISRLWANDSTRNAYVHIDGIGWRRLSHANDSSFVSLVMMASHAEQTNSTVNVKLEADNTVSEMYVW